MSAKPTLPVEALRLKEESNLLHAQNASLAEQLSAMEQEQVEVRTLRVSYHRVREWGRRVSLCLARTWNMRLPSPVDSTSG